MNWIKTVGYVTALFTMMSMSFLSITNKGALIYFWEPNLLVLIVEASLFILSCAVLINEIYLDVKKERGRL